MKSSLSLVLGGAAVTSLLSVFVAAGCSSVERAKFSSIQPAGDAGSGAPEPSSEGDDARRRQPRDERDDDTSCAAKEPIDATAFPYKKAGITPGACTAEEADAISTYFRQHANDEDFTVSAWQKEVGAACARCVFGDGSGATWTPILVKGDQIDNVDRGGCIEVRSGKEACGRAYQQVNDCSVTACLPESEGGEGTCEGQRPFYECLDDRDTLFGTACKDAYDAVSDACGDALGDYEEACEGRYNFDGPIRAMCVGG